MVSVFCKPEWVPENAGSEFASRVMPGVEGARDGANVLQDSSRRPLKLTIDDYESGITQGDRTVLSRAITLVESNKIDHFEVAQELIHRILPRTGNSIRVGITGVPGVGKSTFIETLGCYLCGLGKKVAVLAVDPSSSISGGSILGDKTRMEKLTREPCAFIRPSPSGGTLGGVTRKSRETLLLCEAAGYDVILIETVGVGQSETAVRSMVDFFLLLVLTGAGDDLQGMKKGVIELVDAILVNKADGDNRRRALMAKADYDQMLHYLRPATEGWIPHAFVCSSLTEEGVREIWEVIVSFRDLVMGSGFFQRRRDEQMLAWVDSMVEEFIRSRLVGNASVADCRISIKKSVLNGDLSPTKAAEILIGTIERNVLAQQRRT